MTTKNLLRKQIRTLFREQEPEVLTAMSSDVCRTLLRHPRLQSASHILAFWPLPDEVDIRASVRELWRLGHDIYLPRVVSDTEMVACPYLGDSSLSPGAFGILEPATPPSTLHEDTVALVPGIAFDKQCHRLGRGRGYYDRFLSLHKPYTIGLCYPFQIVSHVPHDNLDIPVDEVLLQSCP